MTDEEYMKKVLDLADKAASKGEVPVAALIVSEAGEILAEAINTRQTGMDPVGHAEVNCLKGAGEALQNWQLL